MIDENEQQGEQGGDEQGTNGNASNQTDAATITTETSSDVAILKTETAADEDIAPAEDTTAPETEIESKLSQTLSLSEEKEVMAEQEKPVEVAAVAEKTEEAKLEEKKAEDDSAKGKKAKKAAEPPTNDLDSIKEGMNWFVVHVYSGFENKARMALADRIKSHKMDDSFGGVLVPHEQVVEMVRGQKKTSSKKFYPGYMMVQMNMNRDTWHLVKETPKVTGFVGDETNPDALTKEEVERLLKQVQDGATTTRASMSFHQGESVKVVDGPFVDFNGTVDEVRPEKGKLRVLISIFGRATPVELDFAQVERLA